MRFLLFIAALFVCASCSTSLADRVPLATKDFAIPDTTFLVDTGGQRVAPLDMLDIKVFGAADMNGSYQVEPNGQLKFPLVGALDAKGYTSFELASIIENKLKEKYLKDPMVTIRITELNGEQFTIEGAIGKPGSYPVRSPLTLLRAVALSGGPAGNANLEGILVFRTIEGKRQAARFDLRKIRVGDSVDPVIYGNDLIVVDSREKSSIYDDILRGLPIIGLFATVH